LRRNDGLHFGSGTHDIPKLKIRDDPWAEGSKILR
jgi:hypothetical protein